MTKKSPLQTGSAHVPIIIVLVVALMGALGFVFWKNFVAKDAGLQQPRVEETQSKKSEIIALEGAMNKYVNHEEEFEFLFPKRVLADVDCKSSAAGYYTPKQGSGSLTVLETKDRYVIMPKNTVVLSDILREDGRSFARACDKRPSTIALADFQNSLELNESVSNTVKREFEIAKAESLDDITAFVHKISGSNEATVKLGKLVDGRQDVSFAFGPRMKTGGFAYKMWYYPAKNKIVYFALGQSAAFVDADKKNTYYDMRVAQSFSFTK